MSKFAAAVAAAASITNQTVASAGGGDYTPLAEGPCRLRLVGYVELGKHKGEFQGKPKENNKVALFFEVSGPKHPPREIDGVKYPNIIKVEENLSLNDKARYFKLVNLLNWEGKFTHLAQAADANAPYKGRVVHRKYKGFDGKERVAAELFDKSTSSWTIEPPRKLDDDTGEYLPLPVDAALSTTKVFLWDHADMEQWASIFVDGEYAEEKNDDGTVKRAARSKNVLQNKIKSAINFKDSPIYQLLLNNGQPVDLPASPADMDEEAEAEETKPAAGPAPDPLAGVA